MVKTTKNLSLTENKEIIIHKKMSDIIHKKMSEYILCVYSFVPYPHNEKNPKFALGADIYAHVPYNKLKKYNDKNHSLAIWLDVFTQEFVVRKEYKDQNIQTINLKNETRGVIISSGEIKYFQEIYRGKDFQEALNMCTILSHKYWESNTQWVSCSHQGESYCCKNYKDKYAYKEN